MTRPFKLTSWPPAPRKNALRGRKAQAAGQNFQKSIAASADFHKAHVALEELPRMGAMRVPGGKLVPTKICVDFIGTFTSGRGLFFDAKSCGPTEVSFNVRNMIAEHQLRFLRRMAMAGACAGFLIECKKMEHYFWLDVQHVTDWCEMRFAYDGAICHQWLSLGDIHGLVQFNLLAEYKSWPKNGSK